MLGKSATQNMGKTVMFSQNKKNNRILKYFVCWLVVVVGSPKVIAEYVESILTPLGWVYDQYIMEEEYFQNYIGDGTQQSDDQFQVLGQMCF